MQVLLYQVHPKTPWITKGILTSRETRNKLYRKYLKVPNEINEKIYKKYQNRFNKLKLLAKKSYYNRKFDEAKGNIRVTWTLIYELINKHKSIESVAHHFKQNEQTDIGLIW